MPEEAGVRVTMAELHRLTRDLLAAAGLTPDDAERVADIFLRATRRGVGHHDIYDLPGRLRSLQSGKANPRPAIMRVAGGGAVESYDGDNGLGEVCAGFAMERAMRLADDYGIGLCTIRHSNHFLAAAPYVERAAEEGYLALLYTKGRPAMSAPGTHRNIIGNNPMGFALPTAAGYPMLLDIAMAYTSLGQLRARAEAGEEIPAHWGCDAEGRPTTDPDAVRRGGSLGPIGEHKGFGLSLLNEALTALLSDGPILDDDYPDASGSGWSAQTAIAIRIDALVPRRRFEERSGEIISRIQEKAPSVRIPGERSAACRRQAEAEGVVLKPALVDALREWAERLGVPFPA